VNDGREDDEKNFRMMRIIFFVVHYYTGTGVQEEGTKKGKRRRK